MPAAKNTNPIKDFEKSLTKLNQLIEKMENGNLPLEEALKCFEEGVTLIKTCQKILSDTEQKVQKMIESNE